MKKQVHSELLPLSKALENKDAKTVEAEIGRLLKRLDQPETPSQEQIGIEAANLLKDDAVEAENSYDLFRLTYRKVDVGEIWRHFPKSEKIAIVFLEIIRSVLGLKIEMRENDNLDIYLDEINDVARALPQSARVGVECSICYANLQANVPLGWDIPMSFVDSIANEQESISARFPNDQNINLIYCRSLGALASSLVNHANRELFNRYIAMLRNLVNTRNFAVPNEIHGFLSEVKRIFGV
jgi:hypothetical protein